MLKPTQKSEYAFTGEYPGRSKSAPAGTRHYPAAIHFAAMIGSASGKFVKIPFDGLTFDYLGEQGKTKMERFKRELFPRDRVQNKVCSDRFNPTVFAPSISRQTTQTSEPHTLEPHKPSRKRAREFSSDVEKTPERPPRRRRSENGFETRWNSHIANGEDMPLMIFRLGCQYFSKKRLRELDEILDSDDEYIRQRKKKIQHIFSYLISFTKSSCVTTKTPVGLKQKHAYMKAAVVAKLANLIKTP